MQLPNAGSGNERTVRRHASPCQRHAVLLLGIRLRLRWQLLERGECDRKAVRHRSSSPGVDLCDESGDARARGRARLKRVRRLERQFLPRDAGRLRCDRGRVASLCMGALRVAGRGSTPSRDRQHRSQPDGASRRAGWPSVRGRHRDRKTRLEESSAGRLDRRSARRSGCGLGGDGRRSRPCLRGNVGPGVDALCSRPHDRRRRQPLRRWRPAIEHRPDNRGRSQISERPGLLHIG